MISASVAKLVGTTRAVTINETSIRLNTTKNIVEIIRPVVQTHTNFFKTPYANIINKIAKTSHTIVTRRVPKKSIELTVGCRFQSGIFIELFAEYRPRDIKISASSSHKRINMFTAIGRLLTSSTP